MNFSKSKDVTPVNRLYFKINQNCQPHRSQQHHSRQHSHHSCHYHSQSISQCDSCCDSYSTKILSDYPELIEGLTTREWNPLASRLVDYSLAECEGGAE